MELFPLFTVPVVLLAGGVRCSVERFTVLPLVPPELRVDCCSFLLVGVVTVPLLRPLSLCGVVVVLPEVPESVVLPDEVDVRPEVFVFLFILDLAGADAGLSFVPEVLLTSGR